MFVHMPAWWWVGPCIRIDREDTIRRNERRLGGKRKRQVRGAAREWMRAGHRTARRRPWEGLRAHSTRRRTKERIQHNRHKTRSSGLPVTTSFFLSRPSVRSLSCRLLAAVGAKATAHFFPLTRSFTTGLSHRVPSSVSFPQKKAGSHQSPRYEGGRRLLHRPLPYPPQNTTHILH